MKLPSDQRFHKHVGDVDASRQSSRQLRGRTDHVDHEEDGE